MKNQCNMKREILRHATLKDDLSTKLQKDILLVKIEDGTYEVNVSFRENEKITYIFYRSYDNLKEANADYIGSIKINLMTLS